MVFFFDARKWTFFSYFRTPFIFRTTNGAIQMSTFSVTEMASNVKRLIYKHLIIHEHDSNLCYLEPFKI